MLLMKLTFYFFIASVANVENNAFLYIYVINMVFSAHGHKISYVIGVFLSYFKIKILGNFNLKIIPIG